MSSSRGDSGVSDSRSSFHGHGIQISGGGDTTINGNVHIGASDLNQLLSDLRVTNPRHDKERIESTKGGLLRDSYRWVLEHKDFRPWCNNPRGGVLWIKGDAGKGKTMLVCGIVTEMELSSDKSLKPAYFFCQATDERINNATAVLRGLLFMLVSQHPELSSYIKTDYEKEGKSLFEGINAWFALARIFSNILEDTALEGKILIIDALDECVTGLHQLLDLISTAASSFQHIKWIVSSRNWPPVEEELNAITQKVTLRLELNAESVSAAVEYYIRWKVDKLAKTKEYGAQLQEEVMDYLAANADGTFLWVALVCQELGRPGAQRSRTMARLKTFPPGLDKVYRRMMDIIMEDSENQDICKQVLAVVSLAYRPLALEELAVLSGFTDDIKDLEEVVRFCASFLTLRGGTVYLVHQSAEEYLSTKAFTEIMPLGISQQHGAIFTRSLEALTETLRRDMYDLRDHGINIDELSTPNPDPLAHVRYSCIHCVDHLQESSRLDKSWTEQDIVDGGSVHVFFQKRFLFWLEALSLQRSMTQAVLAVRKIEALVLRAETQQLGKLIYDARRFILSHRGIVEVAPLQLYMSALFFSPARSLVRRMSQEEQPDWITLAPDMDSDWDAYAQTHETGGSVQSLTFSPDCKRLAAVCSSIQRAAILVWDVTTGACLLKIQDSFVDGYNPVAFSSDGQWLAVGSQGGCVRVWETSEYTHVKTMESGSAVGSVVFWPDYPRLTSAHENGTIKVWDLATSTCLQTIKGPKHRFGIYSLVPSPLNEHVASIDFEGHMTVWDRTNGRCLLKKKVSPNPLKLVVVFSANGETIAVGPWDRDGDTTGIELWDTSTSECVEVLDFPFRALPAAFSPDGQWLMVGIDDGRIEILDASTAVRIRTLDGHRGAVQCVAFSSDGLFASGSSDGTVRILDLDSMAGMREQVTGAHNGTIGWVAFSADGQRLVSGSYDGTLKVWDVATGACQRSLEHGDPMIFATLSPNGQWLASYSAYDETKVWNTATGDCLHKFREGCYHSCFPVFSVDSQRLASVWGKNGVNIWDLATGSCTFSFERPGEGGIRSIAYSADRRLLLGVELGYERTKIEMWDAEAGACIRSFDNQGFQASPMAFSIDGQWFASFSRLGGEIQIRNATTGACVQALEIRGMKYSKTLAFNTKLNISISTDIGGFLLDPSQLQPQKRKPSKEVGRYQGYGISPDKIWIVNRGKRLLWLPPEYRPYSSAVSGSVIALGRSSGRLIWLRFASDGT